MDQQSAKRRCAQAALQLVPKSGVIGLGSGSTASVFIEELGRLVATGRDLVGVPTSRASATLAREVGIPLLPDEGPWDIDLCVDGADEVSQALDLIKGGGGCHTREKIVNAAARENLILVDETKLSTRLGERWPVPTEVMQFGLATTQRALERWGEARLRLRGGVPWLSDAGNCLLDLHVGPIDDPGALEAELRRVPGVVEVGLFVGRASRVLVAGADAVRELRPPPAV
jgi:ribose 5-phosphate isomerase A